MACFSSNLVRSVQVSIFCFSCSLTDYLITGEPSQSSSVVATVCTHTWLHRGTNTSACPLWWCFLYHDSCTHICTFFKIDKWGANDCINRNFSDLLTTSTGSLRRAVCFLHCSSPFTPLSAGWCNPSSPFLCSSAMCEIPLANGSFLLRTDTCMNTTRGYLKQLVWIHSNRLHCSWQQAFHGAWYYLISHIS